MTPSNEGLRYAYESFLGIEAPLDLDLGSLQKKVEDKFLRRPDYSDMSEEEREEQLMRIFDYLDFDYSILDLGIILCENYRKNNLELHKSVFSNN